MSWIVAGIIVGIIAYLVDWVLWGKVFTKGLDAFAVMPPAGQPVAMGPMLAKSAVLALAFGLLVALVYGHLRNSLWVAAGPLAGMELGTILWLPIAFTCLGSAVWYERARPLLMAQFWSWLVRLNVVGIALGLLMR
ncbi:MAG: hypothetical protein ACREMN_10500 [Gemmatimonadales bacterium]